MANERSESERPSPEALLAAAQAETRGKLKIFLGAAPGVGKTYAMLRAAAKRRQEGVDVIVGVVETHGRADTAALLGDMEILPRSLVSYRGITLNEFDIDAALKRRPQLILIDELAHTNAPACRHPKRYQDVEEILDAGIDVYSTVNIQHLESLNDIIARITNVTVRETVPDSILKIANSIELIDIPPEELLQRLKEGKIYIPEQAKLAMQGFFTPGNLTALRELALRHAAEQVDRQMLSYMQTHAIEGPWPTRERILVCVDTHPHNQSLVRNTKRIAERRGVPWVALHVETHRNMNLSPAAKAQISGTLRLAEQLGGESFTITGEDIASEILAFAKERNVTMIIVGRSRHYGWLGLLRGSLADALLQKNEDFNILITGREDTGDRETVLTTSASAEPPLEGEDKKITLKRGWWLPYAESIAAVAIAAITAAVASLIFDIQSLSQVFLLAVLAIAVKHGLLPSLFASAASFVAYILMLSNPFNGWTLSHEDNLLPLLFFVLIAIFASKLGARIGDQVEVTRRSARRTAALFDFSKKTASAVHLEEMLWAVVHHVAEILKCRAIVLLPKGEFLEIAAAWPPEDRLDTGSAAAAEWSWRHGKQAGRNSATLPSALWLFLPLRTARGLIGVLGIRNDEQGAASGNDSLDPEQMRLLESLADQAAIAIERAGLVADIEQARLMTESERLRVTMLSSISQDLRTPLISVLSTLMVLRTYWQSLDDVGKLDLVESARDGTERLNRSIQNLLDMTKLGTGALVPNALNVDVAEMVLDALTRMRKMLGGRKVVTNLAADLPKISVDKVQIEQVLLNILDNICKYTDDDAQITISASSVPATGKIRLSIGDNGPGIPAGEREKVFDVFYRAKAQADQTAGVGLGLAVCRGIIEKHGGSIVATAPQAGSQGTVIVVELPVESKTVFTPALAVKA